MLGSGQATSRHIENNRLMLLGSPPDMVHGFLLRKTHPSTPYTAVQTTQIRPSLKDTTPAGADCRYKAPLSPRLVWPSFTAFTCVKKRFFFHSAFTEIVYHFFITISSTIIKVYIFLIFRRQMLALVFLLWYNIFARQFNTYSPYGKTNLGKRCFLYLIISYGILNCLAALGETLFRCVSLRSALFYCTRKKCVSATSRKGVEKYI